MPAPNKSELRVLHRRSRLELSPEQWQLRSERICAALLALPQISAGLRVALFWPLVDRHEPDLRPLDAALRSQGKRLYYPTMTPPYAFAETASIEQLVPNSRSFFEPAPGAPLAAEGSLDVIVAPALALSLDGTRLGYGAGFYDRALGKQRPPAVVIGVCYHNELLRALPCAAHDEAVDFVVTDELSRARGAP